MPRKNYPYLFGNDPEIAAIQLFKELKDCNEEHERAGLLHLLTYITDPKSIETYLILERNSFFNHTYARAAQLRVDQNNNHPNPWIALAPPAHKDQFRVNCLNILNSDATVDLWLSGGIGDQLEMLTRIKPCLINSDLLPRLEIVIPESTATAMQLFLKNGGPRRCPLAYRPKQSPIDSSQTIFRNDAFPGIDGRARTPSASSASFFHLPRRSRNQGNPLLLEKQNR